MLAAAAMLAAYPAAASADLSAYLRARAADGDDRIDLAVADYALALDAAPDDPVVSLRAYREAVRALDMPLADRAAGVLEKAGAAPADTALLALAEAVRSGRTERRAAAVARLKDGPFRILLPALAAWLRVDTAAWQNGSAPDSVLDPVAERLRAEMAALALLADGDVPRGLDALRPMLRDDDQAARDRRVVAARLLLMRGRTKEAQALLAEAGLAEAGVDAAAARDRRAASRVDRAAGVSYLLGRVGTDLSTGEPSPVAYAMLAAALRADPGNGRALLSLAGLLARDGATDMALSMIDRVAADGPYAASAATARVQVLAGVGRDDEALRIAEAHAARPGAAAPELRRLAALYLRLDRPDDAATLYRRLAEPPGAPGSAWLEWGVALDQAGRWPEAKAALERALALAPEDATVLNYLGYSLVEHAERPADAQAMLERAARLQPDDPAIADSLGWSLLKGGRLDRALPIIERAARADPASPDINEHLGDAYWMAGRRYEARYAWRAARVVADEKDARRLARKVDVGL